MDENWDVEIVLSIAEIILDEIRDVEKGWYMTMENKESKQDYLDMTTFH